MSGTAINTTDALLKASAGIVVAEVKKITAGQVETVRKVAAEELQKIDRRIDALEKRHSLEPALWGAAGGVLLAVLMLILGVWMGGRGVTVGWLLTFGMHL